MASSERNPGAVAATGASKTFSSATERSEDNQPSQRFQAQNRYRSWWQASTLDDIAPEDLRRQSRHLDRLGPRAREEFLKAIIGGADIVLTLESYERIDPDNFSLLVGLCQPAPDALQ